MLRVGVVIEDLDRSGAPWNYARELAAKLHAHPETEPVVVYCRGDASQLPAAIETAERPDRPLPTPFFSDRPLPPRLVSVVREYNLDLIHLNAIPDLNHWPVHRVSVPVVATAHGTLHWEGHPTESLPVGYRIRRRWFDRLGRITVDRVFAVSEYVRRVLVDCAGYGGRHVESVPLPIDDVFFDFPEQPRPDSLPEKYVLHVSNVSPAKNPETLLCSFSHLRETNDIHLIIAGRGWCEEYEPLANELGILNKVTFVGYSPPRELVTLYDHAACFLFPSYRETFGLPNVEAMARGTPVVTSDRFAIPEIVGDAAITVSDPGNPSRIAAAVRSVVENSELRGCLVKRGRERADRFRWSRHLKEVVQSYRVLIG